MSPDTNPEAAGRPPHSPAEILVTRERLGLTRAALGRMLGVSERAVARWERGERSITPANTEALTRLVEQADREVTRSIQALERLGDHERLMLVYRSDEHLQAHHPDSPVTAGWVRAIAGRVAEALAIELQYAD